MLSNLRQIKNYVEEYCQQSPNLSWCGKETKELADQIQAFQETLSKLQKTEKKELLQLSLDIHRYANEKYQVFRKMWTEFDIFSVCMSICFTFWLLVHFFCYGVMD